MINTLSTALRIQSVDANGAIYIRSDGSIDPPTAEISTLNNVTYYFTDNNYYSLVIERDDIVVDGDGYALQGAGTGTGIFLLGRTNVTILNMKIAAFEYGVEIVDSSRNTISGNNITGNSDLGVWIAYSSNYNLIFNNSITGSYFYGLGVFYFSCYNRVLENYIAENTNDGIVLRQSESNLITQNSVTGNTRNGIGLVEASNYNVLLKNNIMGNGYAGIFFRNSCHSSVAANNIEDNLFAFFLDNASNNSFSHNNVVNNPWQVQLYNSTNNRWDGGYPYGGNYWNNYAGVDLYSGPYQNETGSDGIGDTPHAVKVGSKDQYPLMALWTQNLPWTDWSHYHNYSEIVNTLLYLNNTYPNIVDVFFIGRSWLDREIYCIKLTNEVRTGAKPKVLFVGYHHAREPISAELALYFAVDTASSYYENEDVIRMLNCSEIYVIVALNVDGFDLVEANDWQRKNARPFDEDEDGLFDEDPPEDEDSDGYIEDLYYWDGYSYYFIRWEGTNNDDDGFSNEDWIGGVDLNRNYGYQWDAICESGSSDPANEDFRGPAPFSELETQAMRDLALQHDFKYALSFHSGTEIILYPWGYTTTPTPHNAHFRAVAGNLSALVGAPYGQSGTGLYTASGTWDDWMYGNRSTFAFTCEIYRNNSAWQYEPGPQPNTWWEKGVFQFFNPAPGQILGVIQRWLPVFTYTISRAISEATHNVALSAITPYKTIIRQEESVKINATITNNGDFAEDVDVTIYANGTAIETVYNVAVSESVVLTINCSTIGWLKGNYTISAHVWPVEGETATGDNTLVGCWIFVTVSGDVNGDRKVDISDIAMAISAYGKTNSSPGWYEIFVWFGNRDVNGDDMIDITDIATVISQYGSSW